MHCPRVAETSLYSPLRRPHFPKMTAMRNTNLVSLSPSDRSLSQVEALLINTLVAIYDIRRRKGEVLFLCSVTEPTRD
jgi:hypothetical protein